MNLEQECSKGNRSGAGIALFRKVLRRCFAIGKGSLAIGRGMQLPVLTAECWGGFILPFSLQPAARTGKLRQYYAKYAQ
jgi:hypothetical protein